MPNVNSMALKFKRSPFFTCVAILNYIAMETESFASVQSGFVYSAETVDLFYT